MILFILNEGSVIVNLPLEKQICCFQLYAVYINIPYIGSYNYMKIVWVFYEVNLNKSYSIL